MTTNTILSAADVCVSYGQLQAVRNVTLQFPEGGMTGIFGHNGSGKSSFLKSLVGTGGAISGEVVFDGQPIRPGKTHENVLRGIAIVPQSRNVFPSLSVRECLDAAALRSGQNRIDEVHELLPILADRASQRAGSMSGGEQQLLAVGMALITRPKVILLDEPTAGLSPIAAEKVLNTLVEINRRFGTTVLLVEQNVMIALAIVQRALVFRSGEVVYDDSAEALRARDNIWSAF
jgi:branched-chain amino acid transport system ATP-binding protein